MSDETKCCGNCRWWKEIDGPERRWWQEIDGLERGECRAPVPFSMFNRGIWIMNTDGTDCQCFSPLIPQEVQNAIEIIKEDTLIGGYGTRRRIAAEIFASWAIEHMPELKGNQ